MIKTVPGEPFCRPPGTWDVEFFRPQTQQFFFDESYYSAEGKLKESPPGNLRSVYAHDPERKYVCLVTSGINPHENMNTSGRGRVFALSTEDACVDVFSLEGHYLETFAVGRTKISVGPSEIFISGAAVCIVPKNLNSYRTPPDFSTPRRTKIREESVQIAEGKLVWE